MVELGYRGSGEILKRGTSPPSRPRDHGRAVLGMDALAVCAWL
jgi:hypothetical protein